MNTQLTENELDTKFVPIKNHIDSNAGWGGCLFETYGPELEFVKSQPDNKVWTWVDGDSGGSVITAGFHFVNRIGYLITVNPWDDDYFVIVEEEDEE